MAMTTIQEELAEDVCLYLTDHMDRHVTLQELQTVFSYSGTYIKKVFRLMYGEPVFAYIRRKKMLEAAEKIITTDLTITEIAGLFGYSNSSKFSSAFRQIIGISPRDYRNKNENKK